MVRIAGGRIPGEHGVALDSAVQADGHPGPVWAKHVAYHISVDVSVDEAKKRLLELIRAVEEGEKVVITRRGRPVAQLTPAPERRKVQFGWGKGKMKL